MNVLMLTWNYPPVVGGIEQVALHAARGLDRLGHRVRVVAAGAADGNGEAVDGPVPERPEKPGLVRFLGFAFTRGLSEARRERPDWILCPSLTSAPPVRAISIKARALYISA